MNVTIKKASLRGSLFLNYEFEQTDADVKNTIKTSSDAPIHPDLRNAFRALIPHFAFICEEVTDESLTKKAIEYPDTYLLDRELAPDDTFFKFRVGEFAIEEKKGFDFLIISGAKQLKTGHEIYFPTPKIDVEDTAYIFHKQLKEAIEVCKAEVLAYMQGKQAERSQTALEFESEEEEENENLKLTASFTSQEGEVIGKVLGLKTSSRKSKAKNAFVED